MSQRCFLGSHILGATTKMELAVMSRIDRERDNKGRFVDIHGYRNTKVYETWKKINQRCNNPNGAGFYKYGGRGIKLCDRWLNFENFLKDMGEPPGQEYSIDRIDNNGNYEPSNCRWATIKQQANNRRSNHLLTFNGETRNLTEWAEVLNIPKYLIANRIKRHKDWSGEQILADSIKSATRKRV